MLWLTLALSTALFESFKNVSSKFGLRSVHSSVVAFGNSSTTAVILLLILPGVYLLRNQGFPDVAAWGWTFWGAVALSGLLNTSNYLLFMSALKEGEISQVLPLISFSPAFMLVSSPFILNETPSALGIVGVLTIVGGAYVLNAGGMARDLWAPLRALYKTPASRKMLVVAVVASFSAQVDKIGILSGDPLAYALLINVWVGVCSGLVMLATAPPPIPQLRRCWRTILLAAVFNTLSISTQVWALKLTYATYVIAIKRLSSLFNVLLGYSLLGERQLGLRLTGSVIMLAGVLAIIFGG